MKHTLVIHFRFEHPACDATAPYPRSTTGGGGEEACVPNGLAFSEGVDLNTKFYFNAFILCKRIING